MTGPTPARTSPNGVAAIHDEIAHHRAALGDTVAALAAKADVKARVSEKADELKDRAHVAVQDVAHRVGGAAERARTMNPLVVAAAGVGTLVLVAILIWRRQR
jgi:hypothetical protein